MPFIKIKHLNTYYEIHGEGPEAIIFAHGLLWSGRMFDNQVRHLQDRYRCITFDHRGQGRSAVTESGYDMETLTGDAAALIEALDCAPCHFVGLSMGGFVGLRLAIHRPELLKSLTLLESTADPEPQENVGRYRMLSYVARWIGLSVVASRVMPIMFGQKFLNDPDRAQQRQELRDFMVANDRIGITRAVKGVIEREGVYDQLDAITVPTLIAVGR